MLQSSFNLYRFSLAQKVGLCLAVLLIGAFFYFNFYVFQQPDAAVSGLPQGVEMTKPVATSPEVSALPEWMIQCYEVTKSLIQSLIHLFLKA